MSQAAGGSPGRIITFYSYKGGTGRSMALANVAWVLASAGKRVLVIDWDLEAPGLQRYFRPFLVDKDLAASEGLVDFITDFILEAITPLEEGERVDPEWYVAQADILRYAVSLEWEFPRGGLIDFVPAGRQGPDYAARFAAINWQNFYERLGGGRFFEAVKESVRAAYDYVLIDSRTGVSDTAGICTIQMPDTLVVCFTFNNQSIEGASLVTRSAYEQHTRGAFAGGNGFRVVPVPTRVDFAERDKLEQRKDYARWKFDEFIAESVPARDRKSFWGSVEVPYIPYFAYEEILAPFREDPADPKTCLAAFVRIAGHLTGGDVAEYLPLISPEQKQQVLQEFALTPTPENGAAQRATGGLETNLEKQLREADATFLSLDEAEREQARRLWTRLVRVGRPSEGTEHGRVRVQARDLDEVSPRVVESFVGRGLILVGREEKSGQSTFEAASEELLRSWGRLLDWIDDGREFLLWRQRLQASMAAWEAKGQPPEFLLEGSNLYEARGFAQTHRPALNEAELSYLDASWAAETGRRRGLLYRKAAGLGVFALFVVMMLGLGLYNYVAERRKTNDAALLLARQAADLIAVAKSPAGTNRAERLQTALLLAVESQRAASNEQAEALLRENLPLLPRRVASADLRRNVLRVALSADGRRAVAVTGRAASGAVNTQGGPPSVSDWAWQVVEVGTGQTYYPTSFDRGAVAFDISPDAKYLAVVIGGVEAPRTSQTDAPARPRDEAAANDSAPRVLPAAFRGEIPTQKKPEFVEGPKSAKGRATPRTTYRERPAPQQTRRASPPARRVSPARPAAAGGAPANSLLAAPQYAVEVTDVEANSKAHRLVHTGQVYDIAFSPDGRYLATASNDGTTQVLDLSSGKSETVAELGHDGAVVSVVFSGDGRVCATVGEDFKVRVWRLPDGGIGSGPGALLGTITLEQLALNILLNQTGDVCAVVTADTGTAVSLFDVGSGAGLKTIPVGAKIIDLAFGGSGQLLAIARQGGDAYAVSLGNGDAPITFNDLFSGGQVYDLTFSGDGRRLAAMGDSNLARVWAADGASPFARGWLLTQAGKVNHIAFAGKGGHVATAGADNILRVWNLDQELGQGPAADEACARLGRNMTAEEWGRYVPDRPFTVTCQDLVRPQ